MGNKERALEIFTKKNNQTNRLNSGLRFYEVTLTEEGEGGEEVVPRERSLAKMLNIPIS